MTKKAITAFMDRLYLLPLKEVNIGSEGFGIICIALQIYPKRRGRMNFI
jgi:hypothetical protein